MSSSFKIDTKQFGILCAILLASVMTTSHTRLIQTSLPDLRGVWGLDMDEGSILCTTLLAPQLLVAPVIPWLASVVGLRRLLFPTAFLFIAVNIITPFLHGYEALLAAHFLAGTLLGVFITLSLIIMMRFIPPAWWVVLLAFYSLRVTLAINLGVSLGAFYMEHLGWSGIYWQAAVLISVYAVIMYFCVPKENVDKTLLKDVDLSSMGFFCLSTTMLYIGFDQGERLGWFDSGLIAICIVGGLLLFMAFFLNECFAKNPWTPLGNVFQRNILITLLLIGMYCFMVSANSMLITQYLSVVQCLKPLQSGHALLLIPALHLFFIPFVIALTRFLDGRLIFAMGGACLALACWQGMSITSDWVARDFIPMCFFFSLGHPLCFMGLMALALGNFEKEKMVAILAFLQIFRVLFPAIGTTIFTVVLRMSQDSHALFLKQNLTVGDPLIENRIESLGLSLQTLAGMISAEAAVRSFQDVFHVCFLLAVSILFLLILMRPSRTSPICPVGLGK